MKPTLKTDDRTTQQMATHTLGVVCRDNAMIRWGFSPRYGWACKTYDHASKTYDWLKSQKEMERLMIVRLDKYIPPRTDKAFHIYVIDENHVALQEVEEYK
jgi:hypothetical protein